VRPADKRRKFRLDEEGYKALGDCLRRAEEKGEPWQAVLAIRALALTGARRGEIQNLKRIEVDRHGGALRLGDSKTGESIRPAGSAALDVLHDALAKTNGDLAFPSDGTPGKPFGGLPKAFRRIVGDNIPGVTPHKLRHAYGSAAEDLGLTVPTIGALLGHAGHGVTQGYIHKVDPVLVEAANRVATYISRAMTSESAKVVTLDKHRA